MRQRFRSRVIAQIAGLVALIVAGLVLVPLITQPGNPTAGDVKDAIELVAPNACRGSTSIHGISNIGGPGLPDGMRKAREIVCDGHVPGDGPVGETRHRRLAIHYVFESGSAARSWLADSGYELNDRLYGWWLHGRTLLGSVNIQLNDWRRVLALLS